jgi:hypothetical protein
MHHWHAATAHSLPVTLPVCHTAVAVCCSFAEVLLRRTCQCMGPVHHCHCPCTGSVAVASWHHVVSSLPVIMMPHPLAVPMAVRSEDSLRSDVSEFHSEKGTISSETFLEPAKQRQGARVHSSCQLAFVALFAPSYKRCTEMQ